jgi:hypothetical protein
MEPPLQSSVEEALRLDDAYKENELGEGAS